MAETAPLCDLGWKAPGFSLPSTDGAILSFDDVAGPNGTLIMFICNHCPYVKAILPRLEDDVRALKEQGIGAAAICANDAAAYPEDSFEEMKALAAARAFPFPYLHDESQDVARRYGAVCTPDFFGFNGQRELQYRGRLDASGKEPAPPGARRDLLEAMTKVAKTGRGPRDQVPSLGCSIKWRS